MNASATYNTLQSNINKLTKEKNGLFAQLELRGHEHRYSRGGKRATLDAHIGDIIKEIEALEEQMYLIRIQQNDRFWC